MVESSSCPLVTVILPTFNRAAFLDEAFASIAGQSFQDWELVVVDDGSTDRTRAMVEAFALRQPGRVRYVYQANGGAYSARNRGLDHASGRYVAFFDSDDLWLPHHLEHCVAALEQEPKVDWVFGDCRLVNHADGSTISESAFVPDGRPRPFLSLKVRKAGDLRVIEDPEVLECQITHGLYCGLQNSVIRRQLFEGRRFNDRSKVVDDEFFVIRVLSQRATFAYFLAPHVIYRVHDDNSSGSAEGKNASRHLAIFKETTDGLEALLGEAGLTAREKRAVWRRLGHEYFWNVGYVGLWQGGRRQEALVMFKKGLSCWPWQFSAWKTYMAAMVKVRAGLGPHS